MSGESVIRTVCGTCGEVIVDGADRISCSNEECGNRTCLICFRKLLAVMFGHPVLYYPLKCGICQGTFDENLFLQILIKEDLYEKYIACIFPFFWAKDCLHDNEVLLQCKDFG